MANVINLTPKHDQAKTFAQLKMHVACQLFNQWEVSPEIRAELKNYYLIYWSSNHFLANIRLDELNDTVLIHNGLKYKLVFDNCTFKDIVNLNFAYPTSQLLLSLRQAKDKYTLANVCIVRISNSHKQYIK